MQTSGKVYDEVSGTREETANGQKLSVWKSRRGMVVSPSVSRQGSQSTIGQPCQLLLRPTSRASIRKVRKRQQARSRSTSFASSGHSTKNRLEAEADAVGQLTTFSGFLRETLHQFLSFCELSLA